MNTTLALEGGLEFGRADCGHANLAYHDSSGRVGDDAVIAIVKQTNGIENGVYKFVPGASATTRTVLRSATELMLDALRELDEGAAMLEGEV